MRLSGLWTAALRKLALALLRSVDLPPHELRKALQGLDHRLSAIEQGAPFSDLDLAILRLLYRAGCYPGSSESNQSDTRLAKGLSESSLIEALHLDSDGAVALQNAALKLEVLGLVEQYHCRFMDTTDSVFGFEVVQRAITADVLPLFGSAA
jgi:hypothetical protein